MTFWTRSRCLCVQSVLTTTALELQLAFHCTCHALPFLPSYLSFGMKSFSEALRCLPNRPCLLWAPVTPCQPGSMTISTHDFSLHLCLPYLGWQARGARRVWFNPSCGSEQVTNNFGLHQWIHEWDGLEWHGGEDSFINAEMFPWNGRCLGDDCQNVGRVVFWVDWCLS